VSWAAGPRGVRDDHAHHLKRLLAGNYQEEREEKEDAHGNAHLLAVFPYLCLPRCVEVGLYYGARAIEVTDKDLERGELIEVE
jgi:hypothetical protein